MWPPLDQVTTEGFDMQFGTNVLGTFRTQHAAARCLPRSRFAKAIGISPSYWSPHSLQGRRLLLMVILAWSLRQVVGRFSPRRRLSGKASAEDTRVARSWEPRICITRASWFVSSLNF